MSRNEIVLKTEQRVGIPMVANYISVNGTSVSIATLSDDTLRAVGKAYTTAMIEKAQRQRAFDRKYHG